MDGFTTAKLRIETLRLLKLVAAMTGETMYAVLARLVTAEHARLQKRQK